ncbi:MAG: DUF402 domain-containing protein [Clostridia bacterium]|nr:DUF402 domain-containing protein [Clostridia bacterium]
MTEVKRSLLGPVYEFRGPRLFFGGPSGARRLAYGYRLEASREIGGVALQAGDPAVGLFWEDRPYNVYFWLTRELAPRGLYFNVGDRTRLLPDRVEWRDLVVDVVVPLARLGEGRGLRAPGEGAAGWDGFLPGEPVVLDEDELPDDLPPALRRAIDRAEREILARHREVWREIRDLLAPLRPPLRGLAPSGRPSP